MLKVFPRVFCPQIWGAYADNPGKQLHRVDVEEFRKVHCLTETLCTKVRYKALFNKHANLHIIVRCSEF